MKTILFFSFLLLATCPEWAYGQFKGKKFLSGDARIGFNTTNPDQGKSNNSYNYNLNLGIGKFKTETRASGWNLSTALNGGTSYVPVSNETIKIDGIRGFSVGAGHFWEFYKHFNANFGIFGGPFVNADYQYKKETRFNGTESFEDKTQAVVASLGLSAGAYYKLNERWWLTASLAFSQTFGASYTFVNTTAITGDPLEASSQAISYGFSPGITFPSVGLGLRYFLRD
ncbi:hypothetical protein [Dyadobacter sp.]|uniref:hypothetical protein n=1 Tax=Dyadobacter sp. TaxID=1914288 RepID=UPI003F707B40